MNKVQVQVRVYHKSYFAKRATTRFLKSTGGPFLGPLYDTNCCWLDKCHGALSDRERKKGFVTPRGEAGFATDCNGIVGHRWWLPIGGASLVLT